MTSEWFRPRALESSDITEGFTCGDNDLDAWLNQYAYVNQRAGMSRTYVSMTDAGVGGFYALSTGGVSHEDASVRAKKGVPRHEIPAIILTRMGVAKSLQGQGLGSVLLTDACRRVHLLSEEVGVRLLLIHAKSVEAKKFYMAFAEFEESPTDPLHLSLLMKDLRLAIQ